MDQSYVIALQFIAQFLSWYQNSFGQSDITNHHKLMDLVKEAEQIHVLRLKEIDTFFTKNSEEDISFIEGVAKEEDSKVVKAVYKSSCKPKRKKVKRMSRYL